MTILHKKSLLFRLLQIKFVAFIIIIASYSSAVAITLNEALVVTYQTNPQIKAAIASLQSVDEEMPAAISGALPSATSSLQRGKKHYNSGAIDSNGITDTKTIELTQPLFKGGHTYASIKKAKNEIMAARQQFKHTEQQVLLGTVEAYMDLVSSREVYELAKNNKSVLEQHLKATKARFELGEVTQTDVAESKASLAKSNSDLIGAERTLEAAKAAYENTIGQPPVDVAVPENPLQITGTIDELINLSLANNPEIQIAEYNLSAAKDDINIQKSVLLPQLSAFANKQKQQSTLTSSTLASTSDTSTVGFNLSVPLYQSGSEYAKIRQAKHIAGRNSYNLANARNNVREAVIKAYQDFRVTQSLIESNQSSVDAFTVALEGTTQEALAGLRTTIDVLDAEHALFDAKASLIKSRRDEIVSSYALLAQLGKLTAHELGLKIDLYNPEENYNKTKYQIIGF